MNLCVTLVQRNPLPLISAVHFLTPILHLSLSHARQVVGGIYANSLAVLTDAAHLLSDLAGFLISIFALWLASIEPTSTLSFGFHRAEILGALLSVLLIWVMTGILVYEAVFRVRNPEDVDGTRAY